MHVKRQIFITRQSEQLCIHEQCHYCRGRQFIIQMWHITDRTTEASNTWNSKRYCRQWRDEKTYCRMHRIFCVWNIYVYNTYIWNIDFVDCSPVQVLNTQNHKSASPTNKLLLYSSLHLHKHMCKNTKGLSVRTISIICNLSVPHYINQRKNNKELNVNVSDDQVNNLMCVIFGPLLKSFCMYMWIGEK